MRLVSAFSVLAAAATNVLSGLTAGLPGLFGGALSAVVSLQAAERHDQDNIVKVQNCVDNPNWVYRYKTETLCDNIGSCSADCYSSCACTGVSESGGEAPGLGDVGVENVVENCCARGGKHKACCYCCCLATDADPSTDVGTEIKK